MTDAEKSPASGGRVTGVTEIRSAAKWLITTFGAVVAVVAAGLSLSSLGSLEADRLVVALVGGALAAGGVVWVIMQAASVLVIDPVTLADLGTLNDREKAAVDPSVLGPASDIDDLVRLIPQRYQEAHGAYEKHLAAVDDKAALSEYRIAENRAAVWRAAGQAAAEVVAFERVRAAFETLRDHMWLKVLLVLVGVAAVAWGVGGESVEASIDVVAHTPTEVLVQFDTDGPNAEEIGELVGARCVTSGNPNRGVALAVSGQTFTVAMVPTDECAAAVVTLHPDDGAVVLPPEE